MNTQTQLNDILNKSMAVIEEPYRSELYKRLRHLLGAPVRSVELEDEQLDSLLELSKGSLSKSNPIDS